MTSSTQRDWGNPVVAKCEALLRDWLTEEGADRVDIDYQVIHRVARVRVWLTQGGERSSVYFPPEVGFELDDIRPSQVDPHRGAWLYSHFWMEAAEGVLHQEADWMREPVISARPIGGADAVAELERYPRDPEWIPEWMATKAAAYHKEAERRERRRQRDRERRDKKKAEAAQAESNGADERDSGRVGRSDIE